MKSKDRIIIQKIINYITDVEEFIKNMDSKDFYNDRKTITACAFTVSQIGKIVKELTDETVNKYTNIPWSSIRGMRNRIVHDYENIDLSVLWGTMKESLPDLKNKLQDIIFNDSDIIF